jgi:hypothetical protein
MLARDLHTTIFTSNFKGQRKRGLFLVATTVRYFMLLRIHAAITTHQVISLFSLLPLSLVSSPSLILPGPSISSSSCAIESAISHHDAVNCFEFGTEESLAGICGLYSREKAEQA